MPFFTLVAGATGFYLRLVELMDVFDENGLPQRGAGITYALIAVSVAVLVVITIFSIFAVAKHKAPVGFENAFGTDPLAYPISFSLIGIVWFVATIMRFIELRAVQPLPTIELIFMILSALSAISITLFAIEMYQNPRSKTKFALSLMPSLFMCFWLIFLYRQNASNPVLLSYCYEVLAIITAALGFYFTSGFVYNKSAPGKAIFSYSAAIYFCFVTLADKNPISIKLIIGAMIGLNVVHVSMLIRNLKWRGAV